MLPHAFNATGGLALLVFFVAVAGAQTPLGGYPTTGSSPPVLEAPPIPSSYSELLPPSPPESPPVIETVAAEQPSPVAEAVPATPVEPSEVAAAPLLEPAVEEGLAEEGPTARWYYPPSWFSPSPWDSGIEFGLNGSSGTSESLSFRTGGYIKRKADDYKFDGSIYYNKTQSEGVEVQSNALLDLRYDWLFDNSPWTLFIMSQTFYDEFQAFDFNFNANTGFGYQWIDEDWTRLTTSIGTGGSREFGAPTRDRWVAEANFGVNYELEWSTNKKFYAKVDCFPEWEDFSNYRVLGDVGFEFELHEPSNMSLKLSATDRYDSEPQGAEPHNLNYSAMLIWKL